MQGIFKGIQSIINGIMTFVNGIKMGIQFLINMVKSIIELLKLLYTTITQVNIMLGTLPTWLLAFGTATIGVAVLYIIVGRESGK